SLDEYAVLTAVNSGTADNVTLPCKNVIHPDCSSTTWLYNTYRFTETIELVILGKIKDSHMNEKIRLGPDCSLHIHNVSTADTGSYTCRQLINGRECGDDALVYLSILTVVPLKNLMPGSTKILRCLLYTYHNPGQCNYHPFNSLTLRWVSDTDTDLQGDPRYQIHTSSCDSNLTIELQWTDNNRRWRCQLTDMGQVKLSQSYTITFPGRKYYTENNILKDSKL
uniref:Ig-like domain-containing protein n=1 Tax=Paramormyrops kingsleyae TaxID=1676925 RepID=A0A3B3RH84_9TELE